MIATLIIGFLLIVLGLLWARRIADDSTHDDEAGIEALLAVALVLLGAAIFVLTLLVLLARHAPWGWS